MYLMNKNEEWNERNSGNYFNHIVASNVIGLFFAYKAYILSKMRICKVPSGERQGVINT